MHPTPCTSFNLNSSNPSSCTRNEARFPEALNPRQPESSKQKSSWNEELFGTTWPGSSDPSCTCCNPRCRIPCTSCSPRLRPASPDPEYIWNSPYTACSHRHRPANKAGEELCVRTATCTKFRKPKQNAAVKTILNQTFVIALPGNCRQLDKHKR